jgi:two-component system chemotaxis response regulator CheY
VPTVLIVDDSSTVRLQTRQLIEEIGGLAVIEAANGAEGLEAARNNSFDLIIADVNMPVMSGLEMIERVRALPGYASTPIFVLTTEASGDTIRQGKAAGATAWLVKPFKKGVLVPAIKKVLGR